MPNVTHASVNVFLFFLFLIKKLHDAAIYVFEMLYCLLLMLTCCACGFVPHCRKLNLLSFGEEAEEEEKELAAVKTKIKSSHDVLDDPRLLKDEVPINEMVMMWNLL